VIKTLLGKYRQHKNRDIWTQIDRERSRLRLRSIRFEWVKGHADDPYNAMADELANTAAGSPTGDDAEPAHHRPVPEIVEATAARDQPPELTAEALAERIDLPLLWTAQEKAVGIAS
jgi:hypothetical protein